jgi:hypothetical protein
MTTMAARTLAFLGLAFLLHTAAGCTHAKSQLPSDPILVSKTPLFSNAELKPPQMTAYMEPSVPAGPVEAVAAIPAPETGVVQAAWSVRGQVPSH